MRIPNYEAIALARAARSGKISVRFVLLKGIDERGFAFFTDARGHKGMNCATIRARRLRSTGRRRAGKSAWRDA